MENSIAASRWITEKIIPILNKTQELIGQEGNIKKANPHIAEWWSFFYKNSFAIFELLAQKNVSCQIYMTLRLLMEISADIAFITKYPENLTNLEKIHNKIKAQRPTKITYAFLATISKQYKLYKAKNGKIIRNAIATEERIKLAYGDLGGLYDYLNYYSHLNYLGAAMDFELHASGDAFIMQERAFVLQYYPLFYEKTVHAIGELIGSDLLINYSCKDMENAVDFMIGHWKIKK